MSGGIFTGFNVCNGTDIGSNTATSLGTQLSAVRGSYGSYVQLIASTAADCSWVELVVLVTARNNNGAAFRIAIGAAGVEQVVIPDVVLSQTLDGCLRRISLPLNIPAGTRVSAAGQCFNVGGETNYFVNMQLYDGAFDAVDGIAGYVSFGFDAGNAYGTTVTAAGTTNTKGSYTQLVASTSSDITGLFYCIGHTSSGGAIETSLVDIAIGGAGSEKIIIPNILYTSESEGTGYGFVPIEIPAGSRIAARLQSTTVSRVADISLLGGYK